MKRERFMRILIIVGVLFLGSCSLFHTAEQPKPTILVTQKIVYPNIPNISIPMKSKLELVKFDWPRLNNYYSIRNSKKCKLGFSKIHPKQNPLSFRLKIDSDEAAAELDTNGEFWYNCSVLSIDDNSNLYIGLTEVEYKKMVNNTKSMMLREKKWNALLKSINGMLSDWREKNNEASK